MCNDLSDKGFCMRSTSCLIRCKLNLTETSPLTTCITVILFILVEKEIRNYNDSTDFEIHYNQSIWYGGRDKTTVLRLDDDQIKSFKKSQYISHLIKLVFKEHDYDRLMFAVISVYISYDDSNF